MILVYALFTALIVSAVLLLVVNKINDFLSGEDEGLMSDTTYEMSEEEIRRAVRRKLYENSTELPIPYGRPPVNDKGATTTTKGIGNFMRDEHDR